MKLNNETKSFILTIVRDAFWIGFVLFSVFSLLEVIKPKIILNFWRLDLLLMIVVALGVITILFYQPKVGGRHEMKFYDKITLALFSVLIGLAIIFLVKGIGYLCILVGLASAIICYYFVKSNLSDNKESNL